MKVRIPYPLAGLIQVGDGEFVIEPAADRQLAAVCRRTGNPAVIKVLHACSEDLRVLLRALTGTPAPLFDTHRAAHLNSGFMLVFTAGVGG
jgi:ribonuclease D